MLDKKSLFLVFLLVIQVYPQARVGYAYSTNPDVIKCGNFFYYLMTTSSSKSKFNAMSGPSSIESYDSSGGTLSHKVGSLAGNCENQTIDSLWANKRAFRLFNLGRSPDRSIENDNTFPDVIQCQNGTLLYRHSPTSRNYESSQGAIIHFDDSNFAMTFNRIVHCSSKSLTTLISDSETFKIATQATPSSSPSISMTGIYPDFLMCDVTVYIYSINSDETEVVYRSLSAFVLVQIKFINGNYQSHISNFLSLCINKSISTLISEGRAFNLNTPIIDCPNNITQTNNPLVTFAATSTANLTLNYSHASNINFTMGQTTTVTVTGTNSASSTNLQCTFYVTINDTIAPSLFCPSAIIQANNRVVNFNAKATDNSGVAPNITYSSASGSQFPFGLTSITVTATDGSNNSSTCTFDITIYDTQPPTLNCPQNIIQRDSVVSYAATATDNSGVAPTISYSIASGSTFPNGETLITVTADDNSNNRAKCLIQVLIDNQKPVLTCPSNIQTKNTSVTYQALATDLTNVNITYNPASGSTFTPGKTTRVQVTAEDILKNQAKCSFNVRVEIQECSSAACQCPEFHTYSSQSNSCLLNQSQISQINFQGDPIQGSLQYLDLELNLRQQTASSSSSSSSTSIDSNSCKCKNQGVCDQTSSQCTCKVGFQGTLCQYTKAAFDQVVAQKNSALTFLKDQIANNSIQPSVAISSASNILKVADTISQSSFDTALQLIDSLNSKSVQPKQIFNVLSATSLPSQLLSKSNPAVVDKLTSSVQSFVQNQASKLKEGETLTITSEKIDVQVKKVNDLNNLKLQGLQIVSFPTTLENGNISVVKFKENIFKKIDQSQSLASQAIDINIKSGKSKLQVESSQDNSFILGFSIENNQEISILAQIFYSGNPDAEELEKRKSDYFKENKSPECFYWNKALLKWDNNGCFYHDLQKDKLLCRCIHLSIFGSFFKTGIGIQLNVNIGIFLQALDSNLGKFVSHPSFFIFIGFWAFFIIIKLIFAYFELKDIKKMRLEDMQKNLGLEEQQQQIENDENLNLNEVQQGKQPKNKTCGNYNLDQFNSLQQVQISKNLPNKNLDPNNTQLLARKAEQSKTLNKVQPQSLSFNLDIFPQLQNFSPQIKPNENELKQIKESNKQTEQTSIKTQQTIKKKQSRVQKLEQTYKKQISSSKKCRCIRIFSKEVGDNNLIFNTFFRTSLAYSKQTRFLLFWVSIFLTLFCLALFFDLTGGQDSGSFLQNIIQNFWVEIWTLVITLLFLLLIGCLLRLPSKKLLEIARYKNSLKILNEMQKLKYRYILRQRLGLLVMYLIMIFVTIYMIMFFTLADNVLISLWIDCYLFVVIVDLVVIEIVVSIIMSCLVQMTLRKTCGCWLYILIFISLLRTFKNLTGH